jgi:adenylate cyclase
VLLAPALLLALAIAALLLDGLGMASTLRHGLFDSYQRHAARDTPVSPVRVLELASLNEDSLVDVARRLALQGAALVVFTAPMEPGPSPQSLSAKLPPGSDAARAALAKLPEPGHDLAAALQDIKGIVPVLLGAPGRMPDIKARITYRGARDPLGRVPRFESAAAPIALLGANAAGIAAANLVPDRDGVVRRMPLVVRVGDRLVPGLAAEALRVARGTAGITLLSNERTPMSFLNGVGIAGLQSDGRTIPSDRDGRIWLHYSANLRQLDPNAFDSPALRNAIVVVGAEGARVDTPLGPASVAQVTAEGIENLLYGEVLVRPAWMTIAEALALAALGAGMIFLLRFGLGPPAALAMAGAIVLFLLSWYLFARQSILLDAATPSLGLLLTFAAGAVAYLQNVRLTRAQLRMAFSDSLPHTTIETLARRPGLLNLAGETRSVTYLVCGVRGLGELAAAHKNHPASFTSLMQQVLSPLMEQALAHGGTIDRMTADGFAAFWNAPLDDADHALHACEAAHGIATMAGRIQEILPQSVAIGVGIATGPVIAGGFGGHGRTGYSVHGEPVSLAGRLQALTHQYDAALIVADETRRAAERGFAFLELDTIATGRSDPPVTLHALLGNPAARASPKYRALSVFHDHIFQAIRKQHWQMARDLIAQCRRLSGASQKLYDLHLARIAYFEKNPPGENWDGAFRPVLE